MMLEPGTRLGPYEVLALIGAGGMGEVYRARDTDLKRDVAVKVLTADFARDPGRMVRFRREAEVLACLNHPGIATIYGLEGDAIVMEMVEGETLAGPLPLNTALQYAKQIVDALEYAHDRGVIHRDLKPANIKVTPEGSVKLLDFGLAKAIEDPGAGSDPSNSPTLTLGHTRTGVILGTAAYMSPEQAVGKPVDRRTDIFSFGAVLHEMLVGKPAFTGESAGDILAAVVKEDPDWSSLPPETPEWLRGLLRRCLVKDRKQRLQAIGEARIVMENPAQPSPLSSHSALRFRPAGWIAAGVIAAVAGLSLWFARQPKPAEPRVVTHFTISLSQGAGQGDGAVALSRDGSRLAFTAGTPRQIFVRNMDQLEAKMIQGTTGAAYLSFSPDGQSISFVAEAQLKKVAAAGGPVQVLAEAPSQVGPPTQRWETDGSILFSQRGVLMRIPAGAGKAETLATPDTNRGERSFAAPQLLPGGKKVLVTVGPRGSSKTTALDLKTGDRRVLLEGPEMAQYAPSDGPDSTIGHLVYFDRAVASLMAVPFDAGALRVEGPAVPIGIQPWNGIDPFAAYSLSSSGTLAYVAADTSAAAESTTLVWVDRKGMEQPLRAPPRGYNGDPRISPDGRNVALLIARETARTGVPNDIWVYDLMRGTFTRITSDANNRNPVWSADGRQVIYSVLDFFRQISGRGSSDVGAPAATQRGSREPTDRTGLHSAAADGTGTPMALASAGAFSAPSSVSRDGTLMGGRVTLLGGGNSRAQGEHGQQALLVLPLDQRSPADVKPRTFLTSPFRMGNAQFSPDGRWVAYQGEDSGAFEIYVVAYPDPGRVPRVTVSAGGGTDPRWAPNGRELFYRNGDKMMAVDVLADAAFRPGPPRLLFEKAGTYDVAPDGRFLMIKPAAQSESVQPTEMHIIVNWFEELRRRVPSVNK
jgi:Tol biopolymer transport system component/predicted Ser/Thr protein kinase